MLRNKLISGNGFLIACTGILIVMLSMHAKPVSALTQEELDASRGIWDDGNWGEDYKFWYQVSCACIFVGPTIVDVRDDMVTHVLAIETNESQNTDFYDTMNGIFDRLQDAIEQPAFFMDVAFHPTFGYPESIVVDYDQRIADEEWYGNIFGVTNEFEPEGCDALCFVNSIVDSFVLPEFARANVFDRDNNQSINFEDVRAYINNDVATYFGDANLDGEFNSADMIKVFQADVYEDGLVRNARWESGDWDGDREFTTSDLTLAFQSGGYEQGPRVVATAVPEPSPSVLGFGLIGCLAYLRRKVI